MAALIRPALIGALLAALLTATQARADPIARWHPFIVEASARFGVPAAWIERVMRAESGGRTHLGGRPITSPAGAMGLMQIMPGTWAELRTTHGFGPDPHDPRDNILAGAAYLRAMYDRFGYPSLFAAYNAGPARYAAYLAGRQRLPSETRAYLATVAGAAPEASVPASEQPPETIFAIHRHLRTRPQPVSETPSANTLFVPLASD